MTVLKPLRAALAVLVLALGWVISASTAGAGVLALNPVGSGGAIPGPQVNDLLDDVYGAGVTSRDGYYGSTIRLTAETTLVFTFLGFEAGYDNEFLLDTDGNGSFELIFSNKTGGLADINGKAKSDVGDTYTVNLDPADFAGGIIPFMINAHVNGVVGSTANGSNPDDAYGTSEINFFTSFDGDPTQTTGSSLVVFFDDSGAGPDDNHDDMGIRIAAAVPEPGTLGVVAFALAAVGFAGLQRRRPSNHK